MVQVAEWLAQCGPPVSVQSQVQLVHLRASWETAPKGGLRATAGKEPVWVPGTWRAERGQCWLTQGWGALKGDFFSPHTSAHIQPGLQVASCQSNVCTCKRVQELEKLQKRAIRIIRGLKKKKKNVPTLNDLRSTICLDYRKDEWEVTWLACKYLHGEEIPGTKGLFNLMEKGIIRANSWELKLGKFRLKKPWGLNNGRN